jgi:hypothetical protein
MLFYDKLFFVINHVIGVELGQGVDSGVASGSNVQTVVGFSEYVDPYAEDSNWEDVLRMRSIFPGRR